MIIYGKGPVLDKNFHSFLHLSHEIRILIRTRNKHILVKYKFICVSNKNNKTVEAVIINTYLPEGNVI